MSLMPEGSLPNTYTFSVRPVIAKSPMKSIKMQKKKGSKEIVKGTIVYIRELRREGGSCFLDSAGKRHGGWLTLFTALLMSANDRKNTMSIDLRGYK